MDHQQHGQTAAIDLSAFIPQDTANLTILAPGGVDSTGWVVTFAGPSHPKTIAYGNDLGQKNLRRARQVESAQVNGKKYKPEERDIDEVRRENVAFVVARIVDWTAIRLGPGEPIAFSEKAATDLLIRPDMAWATNQMAEFLADERSFTKGSAKASETSPSDTSNS